MKTLAVICFSSFVFSHSTWSAEWVPLIMPFDHKKLEYSVGIGTWAVGKIAKKEAAKPHDHSGGRTFAPFQKRKDPDSNKSNKLGPKKD